MGVYNTDLHEEYISRINRVQDYIESNISEEFSLISLSKIANFSPYHFHRIFSAFTGETLFDYIQRIRLEKAAFLLLANKDSTITEIALACGFSTQASFAKAFKNYFNMSASKLRTFYLYKNNHAFTESNMGKVFSEIVCYNNAIRNKQHFKSKKTSKLLYKVQIEEIQEMDAVYIRHTGPYKENAKLFSLLFNKLYNFANEMNLVNEKTKWLTIYHDASDITDEDKLRISICISVQDEVEVDGEFCKMKIAGGKYAVGYFELGEDEYQEAWNEMFAKCLPEGGYIPDDRLSFELYLNGSNNSNKQIVAIYIPIKSFK